MDISAYKFWVRVDKCIEEKGITLSQFADGIGLKYRNVIIMRNRDVYPRTEYLFSISSFLETSIDWLITGINTATLSMEQIAVEEDPDIKYMVSLMMKDRTTLSLITALIKRGAEQTIREA